jgi:hypothetical protein
VEAFKRSTVAGLFQIIGKVVSQASFRDAGVLNGLLPQNKIGRVLVVAALIT